MKTRVSTSTAAGKFLGRVAVQHASMGSVLPNAPHGRSSKLSGTSVKKTKDENGNSLFTCDRSEVEGDDTVIG